MRNESGPRLAIATVLIVEDDDAIADALVELADEEGCLAHVAHTLVEARRMIAHEHPSVVLLDLTLNGEFGGDLLEELAHDPDAPGVVIVSAFGLATMVGQRYSVPVVRKPFGADQLTTSLRDALERIPRPRKAS
jgi:DNA-binding NtrC family response regulator